MDIYSKLAKIQDELIAPKGQHNKFGNYDYRSCEDILKALKPICRENGCVVYLTNDMQQMGDRFYVKAIAILIDLESGQKIESSAHAREEENKKGCDTSQITGASSSYARKYALSGLFCIDNEKDSDVTNTHGNEASVEKDKATVMAEVKAKNELLKLINDASKTVTDVCNEYGITKPIDTWTVPEFNAVINRFKKENKQ